MPRPVVIVEYNLHWPMMFEEEKRRVVEVVGHKVVSVEHIGSTAVPGLGAKPIIDILAGVHRSDDADECVLLLKTIGYTDVTPQPEEPNWYYCLDKGIHSAAFHLHLVKFMSNHWEKPLLFRDFLRTHPEIAQQYYELKKNMAAKHGSNRISYTDAKTSFIESVVARARQQGESQA